MNTRLMTLRESLEKCNQGGLRDRKGGREKGKLNGNYLRLIPGLCLEENELIGKFKMAADDVNSIRGQVMEYTYIPTGIKRVLKSGMDCKQEG